MADDTVIIEGAVKFREGKKWKPRWCVMRKISPVADCVQLQLYRPSEGPPTGGGGGAGRCAASLALWGWAGAEGGFTLSSHSLTLALLCREHSAVLAFDHPEELLTWQVKVNTHLGESLQFPVEAAEGKALAEAGGGGRLHVLGGQLALTSGLPPKVIGMWELKHIRRFGVVEGKFCFEAGAGSGRGAGVVTLCSARARDIEHELRRRAHEIDGGECAEWGETGADLWSLSGRGLGAGGPGVPRCVSCVAGLSGAARSPEDPPLGPQFRLAWTMDPLSRPRTLTRTPQDSSCACANNTHPKIGPYENYDVPKLFSNEILNQYYETPKRLREFARDDMYRMTRSATSASMALKKSCQCLFQFGRKRKEPTVVEAEETFTPVCACSRVSQWAHSWLRLRRDKENHRPAAASTGAASAGAPLYATVDVARKARRRAVAALTAGAGGPLHHYENLDFALSLENYENAKDVMQLSSEAGRCGCVDSSGGQYMAMSPGQGLAGAAAGAGARAGYAAMCPRALSQPALSAAAPRSASSADSGVSLSPPHPRPPRRARSAGPPSPSPASDLSDYMETLSICSSRSSTDTPDTCRSRRWAGEYQRAARLRPSAGAGLKHRTAPD